MVGTGLHAKQQAFVERIPPEAQGPVPAVNIHVVPVAFGARTAGILVRRVITLINFDQRFEVRVIVAPIGSLPCRQRVLHTDPPILSQVWIENGAAVHPSLVFVLSDRQCPDAAMIEYYVAMTVRILNAALISKQGQIASRDAKQVVRLFRAPP